ncbi:MULTISPECIES: hypothetical protein [unclassified Synechocystis]|nr:MULTISPECIES: hypothetical protein [unclassified Synechocystis]
MVKPAVYRQQAQKIVWGFLANNISGILLIYNPKNIFIFNTQTH